MPTDVPKDDRHEYARNEVAGWRGSCLDLYARGERAVGQCLLAVRERGQQSDPVKLQHLAGQRVAALRNLLESANLTIKLKKSAVDALDAWLNLDEVRAYLAHGVVQVTIDHKGQWFAIFDMTVFRSNEAKQQRWTVTAVEAASHAEQLDQSWKRLSAQLGQIRKSLTS